MGTLSHAWLAAILTPAFVAAQATIAVPGAQPTIQAAIALAAPGDTVLVSPGTYVETIDFLGKAIVVRSVAGAAATTIDGNQAGSVVTFANGESPNSVLDGFTITGGLGLTVPASGARSMAGGIQCSNGAPTIRNCIVTANRGGDGASPLVAGQPGLGGPGGLFATSTALRLVDCRFTGNFGGRGGMGIAGGLAGSTGGRGGAGGAYLGLLANGGPFVCERCRFTDNQGGDGGGTLPGTTPAVGGRGGDGGIEVFTILPVVRFDHCVIANNRGGNGGSPSGTSGLTAGAGGHGGFDLAASTFGVGAVTLTNCAVVGNAGGNAGAGANGYGGDGGGATGATRFAAIASTIAGNVTGTPLLPGLVTGGLTAGGWMVSSASLQGCIVWGNTRGGLPSDLNVVGIVATVQASDIGASIGTTIGTGNLTSNPQFVNLAAGDIHLTAGSPCRHAGVALPALPLFDLDGDPRIVGPATDMGADEFDDLVGSREDFVLALTVNGASPPSVSSAPAAAGDLTVVTIQSPGGSFAGACALLGVELWTPPLAPSWPLALPELQLSPAASVFLVFDTGVGANGVTLPAVLPPGLGGFALRLQAVAVSGAAKNGCFATTAARDLLF